MLKPSDITYVNPSAAIDDHQRLKIEEYIDSGLASAKTWPHSVPKTRSGWTKKNVAAVLKAYEALGWCVTVDEISDELATFDHPERAR